MWQWQVKFPGILDNFSWKFRDFMMKMILVVIYFTLKFCVKKIPKKQIVIFQFLAKKIQ